MVSTKRKPMSEINVVPYIDVMLVLLVIFMATAPLLHKELSSTFPRLPQSLFHKTNKIHWLYQ
ncbi:MAG: hypothetical protein Ct9H90mP27_5270 [Gammaproteobacteria bacterium]|nr:MAG: hypothetical protein Ct9H90mP27_5270 [Gammaproteobacteria bacterium]